MDISRFAYKHSYVIRTLAKRNVEVASHLKRIGNVALNEYMNDYFFGDPIKNIDVVTSSAVTEQPKSSTTFIAVPLDRAATTPTLNGQQEVYYNYWALLLLIFPVLTLFGNVLVILSVVREKILQTVTNYFIVSLAVADLMVAVVVMPFGVYYLVLGTWGLPVIMCDIYIAMDVTSSTSSIFNLVAISIDRYIAVTQPIRYARHKNNKRAWFTIILVWIISATIGAPLVLGLNDTPHRNHNECLFNSQNYIIYSSLGSFYIPCLMMVYLYYNIFMALRERAKKQRAAKRPPKFESTSTGATAVVIENLVKTRRFAETSLNEDRPTNTGSGSNEDDREDSSDKRSVDLNTAAQDFHVIINEKAEGTLSTVTEETSPKKTNGNKNRSSSFDPNGNTDSGYNPSTVDVMVRVGTRSNSPDVQPATVDQTQVEELNSPVNKNGRSGAGENLRQASITVRTNADGENAQTRSTKKERKASAANARFTIYKANKASKKKREKSSAKKERKATKTLAIVLGVFLICWTPFFTCNVLDAICTKMNRNCSPGVTVFMLNTWLGYINSFLNPVIYTIFNPEFRKAFRKILHMN